MKSLFALTIMTTYGLLVRMVFGLFNEIFGIMSISFLALLPFVIGYFTVSLTMRRSRINAVGAFFLPWLTNVVLLIITIIFNIEGAICWIMIYPMVSFLSSIGGLIAFYTSKKSTVSGNTNDDDPNVLDGNTDTLKMSFALLLPLIAGMIEGDRTLTPMEVNIKREIIIPASTQKVWHSLTNINEIGEEERTQSYLSGIIKFPMHLRTTLDSAAVGGKRVAYYENNLQFEETITDYQHEERMVLDINTDPSKIPPTVMDEHIVIGGKYLDILEDTYTLEKMPGNNSLLTLNSRFVITTPFNWYTNFWAESIMSDILQGELNIIKKRATSGN